MPLLVDQLRELSQSFSSTPLRVPPPLGIDCPGAVSSSFAHQALSYEEELGYLVYTPELALWVTDTFCAKLATRLNHPVETGGLSPRMLDRAQAAIEEFCEWSFLTYREDNVHSSIERLLRAVTTIVPDLDRLLRLSPDTASAGLGRSDPIPQVDRQDRAVECVVMPDITIWREPVVGRPDLAEPLTTLEVKTPDASADWDVAHSGAGLFDIEIEDPDVASLLKKQIVAARTYDHHFFFYVDGFSFMVFLLVPVNPNNYHILVSDLGRLAPDEAGERRFLLLILAAIYDKFLGIAQEYLPFARASVRDFASDKEPGPLEPRPNTENTSTVTAAPRTRAATRTNRTATMRAAPGPRVADGGGADTTSAASSSLFSALADARVEHSKRASAAAMGESASGFPAQETGKEQAELQSNDKPEDSRAAKRLTEMLADTLTVQYPDGFTISTSRYATSAPHSLSSSASSAHSLPPTLSNSLETLATAPSTSPNSPHHSPSRPHDNKHAESPVVDSLHLKRMIGSGLTSRVYEFILDRKRYVLKVSRRKFTAEAEREASLLSSSGLLHLPNDTVQLEGVFRGSNGRVMLAMAHQGDALASWKDLTPDQGVALVVSLVAIHQTAGLTHGDVAPRNVLVPAHPRSDSTSAPAPRWIDFTAAEPHPECQGRACREIKMLMLTLGLKGKAEEAVAQLSRERRLRW
ncbi:hypothetical protein JCM3770_006167 [Rhodotorula araucariae]